MARDRLKENGTRYLLKMGAEKQFGFGKMAPIRVSFAAICPVLRLDRQG